MYRVGIAGASGYAGYELVKLIRRHPETEIGWLTSESSAGQPYSDIYPVDWPYRLISLEDALKRCGEVDVVFLCLPHAASMDAVKDFFASGLLVIDLSADFRIKDTAIYSRWYGVEHSAPHLLETARYGLCELFRSELPGARLVAVPGCYPTSVNLGLYPLARAGWLKRKVIVDAKSGISGAGRKTKLLYSFAEANENLTPYSVGHRHRHIAEMEQVLGPASGQSEVYRFLFTPHLVPINRGILSTMYVDVADGVSEKQVRDLYHESYGDEPFIHLLEPGQSATMAHTVGSNRCAIGVVPADPEQPESGEYVITASIDNLLKGASGQALQSFNLATGIDETTGLE